MARYLTTIEIETTSPEDAACIAVRDHGIQDTIVDIVDADTGAEYHIDVAAHKAIYLEPVLTEEQRAAARVLLVKLLLARSGVKI